MLREGRSNTLDLQAVDMQRLHRVTKIRECIRITSTDQSSMARLKLLHSLLREAATLGLPQQHAPRARAAAGERPPVRN